MPLVATRRPALLAAPLLFAALLVSGAARSLEAQVIRGRVVDAQTHLGIYVGLVTIQKPDGTPLARVVTGQSGEFSIRVPTPNPVDVYVQRIGYQDFIAGPVTLGSGDTLYVEIGMVVQPIELDRVEVKVPPVRRGLVEGGFYERRRMGLGRFMEPKEIERNPATYLSELLRRIPGVRLVAASSGFGGWDVVIRANENSEGTCRPRIFLDGFDTWYDNDAYNNVDEIIPAMHVEGIEVYSIATVPAQYAGFSACGAILIWTKRR